MPASKVLRILIVDDSEINLEVMKGMLAHTRHKVELVMSGPEAINALENGPCDLVILDCIMPGMDGFDVARKIRSHNGSKWNPAVPILAVTALASQEVRWRCLNAGMTGFISKPVKAQALFDWIENQAGKGTQPEADLTPDRPPAGEISVGSFGGKVANSNQPMLRKMSEMLIRDATEWQPLLLKLRASDNSLGLRALAHKIRGTADVLGLRDLSEIAARLEQSGPDITVRDSGGLVDELIRSLQNVIDQIDGEN